MRVIPRNLVAGRLYTDQEVARCCGMAGDRPTFDSVARDPEAGFLEYQLVVQEGRKEQVWWAAPATRNEICAEDPHRYVRMEVHLGLESGGDEDGED